MASETTAAAAGAVGVVRRDPMAMRPFCRLQHGRLLPALARHGQEDPDTLRRSSTSTGSEPTTEGHFIWPGFGDNLRVVLWILARCEGKVDAVETPIGYVPKPEDINIEGLDGVTIDTIKDLLSIDTQSWLDDVKNIEDFYAQVGSHVPHELYEELGELKGRLLASK